MPIDPRKIGDVISAIVGHLPANIRIERVQIVCRVGYKEVKYSVSPYEASANDPEVIGKLIAQHIARDLV